MDIGLARAPRRCSLPTQRPADTGRIDTSTPDHADPDRARGWLRWAQGAAALPRTSVTAAVFTGLLVAAETALDTRSPEAHSAWLAWSSTSLANLRQHPLGSLVTSAFLPDGDLLDWVALAMIALVAAGHLLGNLRLAVLATVSHVLSTLVSQAVLALRLHLGASSAAADSLVLDVGPSYVVVPALVVGMAYGGWPARILSAVAFLALAPHLFGGLTHLDVAPIGHCCAIATGLLLGYPLRRSFRRSCTLPPEDQDAGSAGGP